MLKRFKIFAKVAIILIFILGLNHNCSKIEIRQFEEDWSFVVFGDLRQGYGIYSKLVIQMSMIEPTPEFAVCCGDIMTKPGNEVEWVNFWRYSKPITDKMPLFIVRGNHEGNNPASEQVFSEQTNIPEENFYYSFSINDSYFIILDTEIRKEEGSIINEQLLWLTNQLDSVSQIPIINNIFVFLHRPLYPQGRYKGNNLINADELHSLFLNYSKVKIIIAAHEHLFNKYERDGLIYITTGGAGAPLYHGYGGNYHHFLKVSFYQIDHKINIKTIGIFNEIIEDFDL